MNVDKKMHDGAAQQADKLSWVKPEIVRLEAGAAEAGTRTVVQDGPLASYS